MPVVGEQKFGEKLKRLRRERLMTQRKLAEEASIALSTVVNIERSHTEPRFDTIRKLADALDVDAYELVRNGSLE